MQLINLLLFSQYCFLSRFTLQYPQLRYLSTQPLYSHQHICFLYHLLIFHNKKHNLNLLSSTTIASLTHTRASFWRKQSCFTMYWLRTVGERTVAFKIIACCSITQTPTGQSKVWWWMVVNNFKCTVKLLLVLNDAHNPSNNTTVQIADPRKQNTLLPGNSTTNRRTISHHDGDICSYHNDTPF